MKNGGYEFPILKLVEPQIFTIWTLHGPKIVKKNNNQNYFFFIKFDHKCIFLYNIRLQIDRLFKIYEY
jgi:hypothetical protein